MLLFAKTSQSMFDPASPASESIRDLSLLVLAISAFIFIVVEGVLIYAIVRFRRRNALASGSTAAPPTLGQEATASEPPQVYGSKPVEVAWTVAPALIVFVLILVTIRTLWEVDVPPPQPRPGDNALLVTVVGRQWWWEYHYHHYDGQELGFVAANELYMPASDADVDRPVYLLLKSADVCHSFGVPRLAGKTDLIPGRTNHMWLQTDQPGIYAGRCAEYCGSQHANMLIRVIVLPPTEFDDWLANQKKDQAPSKNDPEAVKVGREAFLGQSCISCHRVAGTPAKGTHAPDLTHLMSRQSLAAGMLPNTRDNLRLWIADPQNIKPSCLMPAFGLSQQQLDQIVDYLASLR